MIEIQKRFGIVKEVGLKQPYNYGAYNKMDHKEQWIRITEGCPHNCPFCYEPSEYKYFGIPEIKRNLVKIMDMNFLAKPKARDILLALKEMRVNGKVVKYEMICGWDYRFLTPELAELIKKARFKNLRMSWDWTMKDQYKIKDALKIWNKAGYRAKEITILMICIWKIPYEERCQQLDLLKVWNVKAGDCWFDGQKPPIQPVHWTREQIKDFRAKVRKHNHLINFGIDPSVKASNYHKTRKGEE